MRGWSPLGTRLVGAEEAYARKQHISIIGAISIQGLMAKMTVRGGVGTKELVRFVERHLMPAMVPGQILLWDNLNAHKNTTVKAMLKSIDVQVFFLPPYSPDLNPIEHTWSKLKHFVRKFHTNDIPALRRAIYKAFNRIVPDDIVGWSRNCGYG